MDNTVELSVFERLDIRVGTVITATHNPRALQPAYILEIDFGPLGIKTTSAQITENYKPHDLVGQQITAIVNLPVKIVAGVKSEVLVLAATCKVWGNTIIQPKAHVENGAKIA